MLKRRRTIEAIAWYLAKSYKEAAKIYRKARKQDAEIILQMVVDYQNGIWTRSTAHSLTA